jgi:predicted transposase YbfD/YdcC
MVESVRTIAGKSPSEICDYLNSFQSDTKLFAHAVRNHWQIENCLHWVLDVGFGEDDCRIRSDNAPQNIAMLRYATLCSIFCGKNRQLS